jgi:hypothetical protein
MKLRLVVLVSMLSLASLAFAGQTCQTATVVPSDGRVVDFDFVANSTTNFYQFGVTKGHSYSVEVRQDYDDPVTPAVVAVTLSSNGGVTGGCTTAIANDPTTGVGPTDTTGLDPAEPSTNSFREAFIAPTSGVYGISVQNTGCSPNPCGRYLSVAVSDTTLVNTRWACGFGTNYTSWGLTNTTSQQIVGALAVNSSVHSTTYGPFKETIGGSAGVFVTTPPKTNPTSPGTGLTSTQLPNCITGSKGDAGSVTFAYIGPPGAILPDGYIQNDTGPVIQPIVWQAPRQSAH